MKKRPIAIGAFLFSCALLFPPWSTPDSIARSIGNYLGQASYARSIVLSPFWDAPASTAYIMTGLWVALLLTIVGLTTLAARPKSR